MATIAVRVGREIKEISGLTKSTTCWDVVLALLKEKQEAIETDSVHGTTEKSGEHGTEESASNSSMSKPIKELTQSYVVVENWRGCEKPIPPRTRILNVWQAWGKEQRHVELSLKKSKHIRFREGSHHYSRSTDGKSGENGSGRPDHASLHCMSNHQKRRIRRSMRQYQRAVMMKQNEDDAIDSEELQIQNDTDDSTKVLFEDINHAKSEIKSEKRNGLILSEEKFIDGCLTDPDCLIRRADRAELINQGTFNREFCKYRRRNRRHQSSIDSRQHRHRQVSHYPYSSHHDRRRSSRHRGTSSKSPKYRYSTDDTSTTTATTTTNSSEDENADDADDEKSVLIEFTRPIPRRSHPYGAGLGDRATATDSSTTTSGDSMTSSMTCSTSSETSSGGDSFLPELNRLSCGRAIENIKKASDNSRNKPKKSKSILGGLQKPALDLIESFRKTNLRRKSAKKNNQPGGKQESPVASKQTENNGVVRKPEMASPKPSAETEKTIISDVVAEKEKPTTKESKQPSTETSQPAKGDGKVSTEDNTDEQHGRGDVLQTVQSQDIVLKNQLNRLTDIDTQIEQIENDVHNHRTKANGMNYVQDAYLSCAMEQDSNSFFSGPSIPVTTPWILQCEDMELLEQFIKMSEKIVEMQIKIEEHNRKPEILLQDMQEEVWRVSAVATQRPDKGRKTVSKAAALMLGFSEEDDSSDEEEGHDILSVKSWNESTANSYSGNCIKTSDQGAIHLELETSRTELESSLYLSLRLAAEIEEVEDKLGSSDYLIQEKGENLIKYVRHLAMSEEGVDPEIWEEYGELLTAYDIEVQQRKYLKVLESSSHTGAVEVDTTSRWPEDGNTLYIDATSPNPTSHCVNGHTQQNILHPPSSPSKQPRPTQERSHISPSPALHQALSPWVWCKHCKMEEQMMNAQSPINRPEEVSHNQHPCHPHAGVVTQPPTLFSQLPLPKPINKSPAPHSPSVITSGLLPMLPIPDGLMSSPNHNESDYEDLPDLTSMGPSDPSKSSRDRALVDNEGSNNTDDSGNASAGSTTSFTSSDGSRNSSCDGGSPRPIPTAADMAPASKPLFGRIHFVFPPQNKSTQPSKNVVPMPPPPSSNKPRSTKPDPLPKPKSFQKAPVIDPKEQETLIQQQRLIRRNSGGRRKNANNNSKPSSVVQLGVAIEGSITTFKDAKLQNVSSGKLNPTDTQRKTWSNQIPSKSLATDQKNLNYDNDSDTGRSSLHSVDSDQIMFSETLV